MGIDDFYGEKIGVYMAVWGVTRDHLLIFTEQTTSINRNLLIALTNPI